MDGPLNSVKLLSGKLNEYESTNTDIKTKLDSMQTVEIQNSEVNNV
jgi:hypothetical protein